MDIKNTLQFALQKINAYMTASGNPEVERMTFWLGDKDYVHAAKANSATMKTFNIADVQNLPVSHFEQMGLAEKREALTRHIDHLKAQIAAAEDQLEKI